VKPTLAGLTPGLSFAGLSKRVLGLGIRAIETLEAGMIASGTPSTFMGGTGAGTAALAGTAGRPAARCFDNLNHSTQSTPGASTTSVAPFLNDGVVAGRLNPHDAATQGKPRGEAGETPRFRR
jgi:hypothetical protein